MTDAASVIRYRRLFAQMGAERARATLDQLQVVALTSPHTMRDLETFLDRTLTAQPRKKGKKR
jgi:hypothetical protein